MSLGYYNFGNIQQGNQQVVNQLTGLGQQISGAIENQAQISAAKAMLPSLQSQIQQGLQKVSNGDASGLSDVYGAAMTGSQIPLLAQPMTQAVNMATQASETARTNQLTQARVLGALLSANARVKSAKIAHGEKGPSQTELLKMAVDAPESWNSAWNGDPSKNIKGLSDITDEKGLSDPNNLKTFITAYDTYSQQKRALNKNNVNVNNRDFDQAAQTAYNVWANKAFSNPNNQDAQQTFSNVASRLGMPASKQDIIAQAQQAIANAKDPDAAAKIVASKLKSLGINLNDNGSSGSSNAPQPMGSTQPSVVNPNHAARPSPPPQPNVPGTNIPIVPRPTTSMLPAASSGLYASDDEDSEQNDDQDNDDETA